MIPIRDNIPSRRTPYATLTLIVVNVLLFVNQWLLPDREFAEMVYQYGFVPVRFLRSLIELRIFETQTYLPMLSSMFLHGNWVHLISNMWMLWLFGDNVEDLMGYARFVIFYILCGLIAGFTHFLFNPASSVPTVGASGAIAGVMGAYFVMFPHSKIATLVPVFVFLPMFIHVPAFIYLIIWFISQLLSGVTQWVGGSSVGGIAWWAHISGFIAGVLMHRYFVRRRFYGVY
ncbi:MAG: rhomboid family intramembrane serine protease [Clostridiales bacterium]|jgi:membrane associated rhomboid family serine protease|nr:rhomboid family intramembrane serine protease [Clostridiales bacterium]